MGRKSRDWGRVLHRVGSIGFLTVMLLYGLPWAPRFWGMNMFAISSGSMEPEIPIGSIVYTEDAEPAALQTGDIIVFASSADGGFVTHRVVRNDVLAERVTTKGDANDVEDPMPVDYGNVFGKVKWNLPLLGFVMGRAGRGVFLVLELVFIGLMTLGQKGLPENRRTTRKTGANAEET